MIQSNSATHTQTDKTCRPYTHQIKPKPKIANYWMLLVIIWPHLHI